MLTTQQLMNYIRISMNIIGLVSCILTITLSLRGLSNSICTFQQYSHNYYECVYFMNCAGLATIILMTRMIEMII